MFVFLLPRLEMETTGMDMVVSGIVVASVEFESTEGAGVCMRSEAGEAVGLGERKRGRFGRATAPSSSCKSVSECLLFEDLLSVIMGGMFDAFVSVVCMWNEWCPRRRIVSSVRRDFWMAIFGLCQTNGGSSCASIIVTVQGGFG